MKAGQTVDSGFKRNLRVFLWMAYFFSLTNINSTFCSSEVYECLAFLNSARDFSSAPWKFIVEVINYISA